MGSSLDTVALVCLPSVRLLGHPLVVSLDWHLDVFGVFKTALACDNEICHRHRTWKMEIELVDVKGRRVRQSVDETIHGLEYRFIS